MPVQPKPQLVIEQPLKGVVRSDSREQPEPQSLISSSNVVPYGPQDGFRRLTQRAGTAVFGITSTTPIQGMLPIGYIIRAGAPVEAPETINFATYLPTGIISTDGTFLMAGGTAASTSWSVSPLQPIIIKFGLNLSVTPAGMPNFTGTFSPPGPPTRCVSGSVHQAFYVMDSSLNQALINIASAQMEVWTGQNAGSIHGISIPAATAGDGYVVCFAGAASNTWAMIVSTQYTLGTATFAQNFSGSFSFSISTNPTEYDFAASVAGGSTYDQLNNGYGFGFGAPETVGPLSTSLGYGQGIQSTLTMVIS